MRRETRKSSYYLLQMPSVGSVTVPLHCVTRNCPLLFWRQFIRTQAGIFGVGSEYRQAGNPQGGNWGQQWLLTRLQVPLVAQSTHTPQGSQHFADVAPFVFPAKVSRWLGCSKTCCCWPGLAPHGCPRASASIEQLDRQQLAGKPPVRVAILRYRRRQSPPCWVKPQH